LRLLTKPMSDLAVAHVSNVIGGGMGTVFRVLLPAQVRRGAKVTFFVRHVDTADAAYFAREGVDLQLVHGARDLARRLRSYDIVHLHSADLDLLVAGWLSHRPTVFTLHGLRAQTRGLGSAVRTRRLPTIAGARRRVKRAALSFLLRHGMSVVTTVSEFLRAKALSSYGLDPGRVVVVHNGIALEQYRRQSCGRTPGRLTIGWVGRLVSVKRVDILLRLTAALASQGGLPGLRLLIVGDGALEEELRAQARSLGITDMVDFVGFAEDPERYLAQMDLFVFPSQNEGAGLVVNEAVAVGVPVVVLADGGGAVELVRSSGAGVVADDEVGLVSVVAGLLADAATRARLVANGDQYVAAELDPGAWAARMDAVYRSVLAPRQARAR
jgi:glycosyltransferase involved in cell wall biosynthesis